ncbi:hypothetical protein RSOLAG1IB_00044 [Rhizoctonia solani AG-1 IB]|uniref:DUF6535 domain-containing protein n=1 Tax=Thanatephorus cucumeris (strain AG1-IB / isolate 7/3/14) TaxID=1108050 RepID=A0A0B7F3H5_THACB|nr:hypothetical protein RSOLAG1IB_00044 [Rhizoctonia solani AG-1 IB]
MMDTTKSASQSAGPPPIATEVPKIDTQETFDNYGEELDKDARVWKAYVKESRKFDIEQFNGWNRFVIESSKMLRKDPAEASAKQLALIYDVLLGISNNSLPTSSSGNRAISSDEDFSPGRTALCINTLWFFSLVLSAAVSFIAILAKEWCYLFLPDGADQPWETTKARQACYQGIEQWKMKGFVNLLPSLLHIAFASFSLGLCVFLWDIHFIMAIPAIIITCGAGILYIVATLLPLLDMACPYSTRLSKSFKAIFGPAMRNRRYPNGSNTKQESIAIHALAWLIKNCDDPRSADVALQAIAGAHENTEEHKNLLKKHGADTMIRKRLQSLKPSSKNYGYLKDLYERAYSFFEGAIDGRPIDQNRGLRWQLYKLQTDMERSEAFE